MNATTNLTKAQFQNIDGTRFECLRFYLLMMFLFILEVGTFGKNKKNYKPNRRTFVQFKLDDDVVHAA